MKTLIFLFAFVLAVNSPEKTYCDGWDSGWDSGYCYEQGFTCVAPVCPVCPVPKVGLTEYQDGYNRGFKKGEKRWEDDNE